MPRSILRTSKKRGPRKMLRSNTPAELHSLSRQSEAGGRGVCKEIEDKRKSGPPHVPIDLQNARFMRQSISNYVTQAADAQNNVRRLRELTDELRKAQLAALTTTESDGCRATTQLESVMDDIGSLANRVRLQLKLMEPQPAATAASSKGKEYGHTAAQQSQYVAVGVALYDALARYFELQCGHYRALRRAARIRCAVAKQGSRGSRTGEYRAVEDFEHFPVEDSLTRPGPLVDASDLQSYMYDQEMRLQRVDAAIRKVHVIFSSSRRPTCGSNARVSFDVEKDERGSGNFEACGSAVQGDDGLLVVRASGASAPKQQGNTCKCLLAFLFMLILFSAIAAAVTVTLLLILEKRKAGP